LDDKAVILIAMLNDSATGDLRRERTNCIIPNLKELVEGAHKHNKPVISSNNAHYSQDVEVVAKWGKHASKAQKVQK
jgi:nicotinamidase-related amidase